MKTSQSVGGRCAGRRGKNLERWSLEGKFAIVLDVVLLNEAELAECCRWNASTSSRLRPGGASQYAGAAQAKAQHTPELQSTKTSTGFCTNDFLLEYSPK